MAKIKWVLDPLHSEVLFKVKHLMLTTVTGYFRTFNVTLEADSDNFEDISKLNFSADVNTIDTNNQQRDTHLKSADFFNVPEHGEITFTGTRYQKTGNEAQVDGILTIRGVSKPVLLLVKFEGVMQDAYSQTKAGFTVDGKISRKEFNLTWNALTEAGSIVVGDEVKIHAEIQLIREQALKEGLVEASSESGAVSMLSSK